MHIDFSTPTTRRVDSRDVEGGGRILTMENIGNTDFDSFEVVSGALVWDKHAVYMLGAGCHSSVTVPDDKGEMIELLAIAAPFSVRGNGWTTEKWMLFYQKYITDNYRDAAVTLDFDITAVGLLLSIERE